MTVETRAVSTWEEACAEFATGEGASAPDWVREIRDAGFARFRETGLPGKRDEEWRFTNLAPITEGTFRRNGAASISVGANDLAAFDFPGLGGPLLVFVDGVYAPDLSRTVDLPDGVIVAPLAEAWSSHPDLVRPHLGRLAERDGEAFTALNSSLFADGVFVRVEKGVVWPDPVRALFVSTDGSAGRMSHPRNLFIVEESADATLIEDWVSIGEGAAFTNAVTEIVAGDNARAHHYVLERENRESLAVSTVHAEQGRDSFFASHSALMGGRLVRNNVYPVLTGAGCDSLLNGFYVPSGHQHHDTHMVVRHAAPHGDSRQYYRGILEGEGHAVFSGRIIVDEGAQKTDAKQSNMNLLLSDNAVVDTKPQLEIYADDVKCTHGATVGQLDADAIFYMKARGIPEDEARGLLVFAFVNEVLERMALAPIREGLSSLLTTRLGEIRG